MTQPLRFARAGHLIWSSLFLLCLAACSSAPPAPIQTRTSPSGVSTARPPLPAASTPAPIVSQTPQPFAAPPRLPEPAAVESAPLRPASIESRPLETRPSGSSTPAPMAAPQPPSSSAPVLTPPVSSLSPASSTRTEPRGAKQPYSESALADMKSAPVATAPASAAPASAAAASAAAAAAAAATAKPVDNEWSWPTNGRVVQNFAESSKGIALGGSPGDAVSAAAEGKVIFSGNGPRGYGNLVIVKHANDLLSVYAHNRTLLVKEGQMVKRGQKIAEVGETGGSTPRLLFEIRQQGKPIDPATILPRR